MAEATPKQSGAYKAKLFAQVVGAGATMLGVEFSPDDLLALYAGSEGGYLAWRKLLPHIKAVLATLKRLWTQAKGGDES